MLNGNKIYCQASKGEEHQLQPTEWLVGLQTAVLDVAEQKRQVETPLIEGSPSHICPLLYRVLDQRKKSK